MLSVEQKTSLNETVTTFQNELARDTTAQAYLVSRGLTPEVASTFRLGSVPSDVPGYEQYAGRLAIPYITPTGVVDIRFRSIDDGGVPGGPKYLSRSGGSGHLYNTVDLFRPEDYIAICEGEIDTITCHAAGIPAVGLPGANSWKPHWHRAFTDYVKVFVFCDGDEPGRELGKKIRQTVDEAVPIHLPDGEDVNSLVLKYGAGELRRRAGL